MLSVVEVAVYVRAVEPGADVFWICPFVYLDLNCMSSFDQHVETQWLLLVRSPYSFFDMAWDVDVLY